MISFDRLNSVVKKIQKKGFAWLYTRVKRKIVSPTFNFAEKHQFLSWKQDTFENIRGKFLEFVGFALPLEKSGNVDKGVTFYE